MSYAIRVSLVSKGFLAIRTRRPIPQRSTNGELRGKIPWGICFALTLFGGRSIDASDATAGARDALIVVGAGGTEEYLADFQRWAQRWQKAFPTDAAVSLIAPPTDDSSEKNVGNPSTHRQQIIEWIDRVPASSEAERWLVLIGHGTYQSKTAKFNLVGPDISAEELAKTLEGSQAKWRIIVCASCSAPFIQSLSGKNRVVVTATKSGSEQNFSRFGDFLSQTIVDVAADLDHDGAVSLLESFLTASAKLASWYAEEGRLASEQPLLDDNGDKRGTPATFFRGIRAVKAPADGLQLDGARSNRISLQHAANENRLSPEEQTRADDLEQQIEDLRRRKKGMDEDLYYGQLENLLIELATLLVAPSSESGTNPHR